MVTREDYERWRRFFPYVLWSSRIINFWNRAVSIKSKIRFATVERATEMEDDWRDEIETIRTETNEMCEAIRRSDWRSISVDRTEIPRADTRAWLMYYVPEGIEFDTLCANINFVLDDAIEELEAKIPPPPVVKWVPFIYTLTFAYPFQGKLRQIEFELKSGVADTDEDKERMMELVQTYDETTGIINMETIPAKIIERAEYTFMFEHPDAFTSRFDFKEPVKKPESETIVAKLIDQNASFVVATADGTFTPPEWWLLTLEEIMGMLSIKIFRRRK